MTLEELRKIMNEPVKHYHNKDEEHDLQEACVNWFRYTYPNLSHTLFAVPNGGRRDKTTGAKLKAEGVLAGVSDLILLKSNKQFGALLIEMKTEKGKQSESQKTWEKLITQDRYKYVVCRDLQDFQNQINSYLYDT